MADFLELHAFGNEITSQLSKALQRDIDEKEGSLKKIRKNLEKDSQVNFVVKTDLFIFSTNKKARNVLEDSMRIIHEFALEHKNDDQILIGYSNIKKKVNDLVLTRNFTDKITEILDDGIKLINSRFDRSIDMNPDNLEKTKSPEKLVLKKGDTNDQILDGVEKAFLKMPKVEVKDGLFENNEIMRLTKQLESLKKDLLQKRSKASVLAKA